MKFKKAIALALSAMMISTAVAIPMNASAATVTNKYATEAAKLDQKAYTGNDLGATYTPAATTFKVWSPTASKAMVRLYATGSASESKKAGVKDVLETLEMTFDETNGVWSVTVEKDLKNVYYQYLITIGGKTGGTGDIYAKAAGVNGNRSMVVDLDSTDPKGWENDTYKLVPNQTDANIWEIHVKDFSYDKSSGVSEANRGRYLAFTESGTTLNGEGKISTCVDYLKDMGIKYVHINPFYDFGSIQEDGPQTQFNWGYDPKNYNVPEGSYSSNPYDGNVRINEVKQMVMALHNAGIGIIMDVVYNHTHEGETSFFNKTVPNYYYRVYNSGKWANNSGCGNDTASERAMYRKYMIDSVTYWAQEYHIDGFRFDLMGLHDVETMNQIRASLDTINPDLIMYGEGWNMTGSDKLYSYPAMANQTQSAALSTRISYFNDQFRDAAKGSVFEATGKGFLQEANKSNMGSLLAGIMANTTSGNWKAQTPEQTVTYVDCHDNHTLYDRLVASVKGELTDLYSNRYEDLIQMNKMSAALVYTSQGVPFILAGEEFARTKYGDHNSYKSSPEINKLDWNRLVDYADLVSYYKGMIKLRDAYAPFRDATGAVAKSKLKYVSPAKLPVGVLAYTINDDTAIWKNVAVIFNSSDEAQTVTLPGENLPQNWVILVNGEQAGVNSLGEINTGAEITIPANTSYVLADKASYESSGVKSDTGTVVVKHINASTGEILKQMTIADDCNKKYVTQPDATLAIDYDLEAVPNNAEGVFMQEPQTVEYKYIPYTLKAYSLSDGKTPATLMDAVLVQKHALEIPVGLTEEQIKIADVNFDGVVNIKDAISYQKIVLNLPVSGVGSVTTKYVDTETGEEIAASVTTRGRAGEAYTTSTPAVKLYVLDETKIPANAEGVYSNGEKTVTYAYKLNAVKRFVHVKLLEGQTWIPNLYSWEDGVGDYLGAWPGTQMSDADGDGWYDIQINTTTGVYNWIINDGSGNQTTDNVNADSDLWVVMKVAKPNKGAAESEYTVYTEKPAL
ncbi:MULTISPECIES: type I pullulanase [unclassified Ruminococcus]|uniref:type I pullulanase n=1 Tax=unclassified Ruminococcus TaxID=2608920 RepID=UPI00210E606A|nr:MULTISPECIES: type I pullulanase [unclassified Ruminococcus]MCQ4021846.1 type I pullulanase [Ruminococcus sp. zg-924]MCQ4114291.1 type I pullulanase [Ruminococcus sp. zg-921]